MTMNERDEKIFIYRVRKENCDKEYLLSLDMNFEIKINLIFLLAYCISI